MTCFVEILLQKRNAGHNDGGLKRPIEWLGCNQRHKEINSLYVINARRETIPKLTVFFALVQFCGFAGCSFQAIIPSLWWLSVAHLTLIMMIGAIQIIGKFSLRRAVSHKSSSCLYLDLAAGCYSRRLSLRAQNAGFGLAASRSARIAIFSISVSDVCPSPLLTRTTGQRGKIDNGELTNATLNTDRTYDVIPNNNISLILDINPVPVLL